MYGFLFQTTDLQGVQRLALLVDFDIRASFSDFCEDIYKSVSDNLRLKASTLIIRLPVDRPVTASNIQNVKHDVGTTTFSSDKNLETEILDECSFIDSPLWRRFGHIEVRLLFSRDYEHQISLNILGCETVEQIFLADHGAKYLIEQARLAELTGLLENSNAIFPEMKSLPYLAPSGRMVNAFVRVGNVQTSRWAIRAFFFWMLPYLKNVAGIVCETWSISSIAYNSARLLSRYRQDQDPPCVVDMLSEYHTGSEARRRVALEVFSRIRSISGRYGAAENTIILMLFSAVKSGGIVENIKRTLGQQGISPERVRSIALYDLGLVGNLDGSLCNVSHLGINYIDEGHTIKEQAADQKSEIQDNSPPLSSVSATADQQEKSYPTHIGNIIRSTVNVFVGGYAEALPYSRPPRMLDRPCITIDPTTYFPAPIRLVEISIRQGRLKNDREFWDRYGDADVVWVHRSYKDDRPERHHAVFIDTQRLVQTRLFAERFRGLLNQSSLCPKVIIAPDHMSARMMAEMARVHFRQRNGIAPDILSHSNLYLDNRHPRSNDASIRRTFRTMTSQDEVLILDDAYITGTRLYQFQQHLRHLEYNGRIRYVVAIARPTSVHEWNQAKKLLSYRSVPNNYSADSRHTLDAVEFIVLPNVDDSECPWCIEERTWRQMLAHTSSVPKDVSDRYENLGGLRYTGLRDRLFLNGNNQQPITLTHQSIFTSNMTSQAVAYAAVASGLQRLRTEADERDELLLGRRRYPIATVLNSIEYLRNVFSDTILRASIIRAAHWEELTYHDPAKEAERNSDVVNLINDESGFRNNASLELFLAAAQGKLPQRFLDRVNWSHLEILGAGEVARCIATMIDRGSHP